MKKLEGGSWKQMNFCMSEENIYETNKHKLLNKQTNQTNKTKKQIKETNQTH